MDKKPSILAKALAKLNLMQKQLVEESQVLDELKEQEAASETELETLRAELEAKTAAVQSLGEELKKTGSEKEKLEAGLKNASAEFKLLLARHEALQEDQDARLKQLSELTAANQHLRHTLKEKEEVCSGAIQASRAEAAEKEVLFVSLRAELKKYQAESAALSHKLAEKAGEFKAGLEKERAEFRLNLEKLEAGGTEAEKGLLGEIEALRESLRQKAAEAARSGAEIQKLLDKNEALAADYEGRLLKLETLTASLKEELKRQKAQNDDLSGELRGQAAESGTLLDKEKAEAKAAQAKAQGGLRELEETAKHLRRDLEAAGLELEKLKGENAAVKALRDAGLVKIKEQEMFSKSALSALHEKEEDLQLLNNRVLELADELSKHKADTHRRAELLRLELDEKNRLASRLARELEAARSEIANLKAELETRPKDRK